MNLKTVRVAAWAAVGLCIVAVAAVAMLPRGAPDSPVAGVAQVGGPFELEDHKGQPVSYDDLRGQKSAIFFGYTHCPDVCPTTLFEATIWLEELGDDGDDLKIYFITVDPERDTSELLNEYLTAFDPRITGLTGDQAGIDQAIENFRVYAARVPGDDPEFYLMDHTASVFLFDGNVNLVGTIDYQEDKETALAKLRRLLAR